MFYLTVMTLQQIEFELQRLRCSQNKIRFFMLRNEVHGLMFLEHYLSDINAAASTLSTPNALQRFAQFVSDHTEAIFDEELICSEFSDSEVTLLRRSGFLLPYMVSSESQYRLYHPKVITTMYFLFDYCCSLASSCRLLTAIAKC